MTPEQYRDACQHFDRILASATLARDTEIAALIEADPIVGRRVAEMVRAELDEAQPFETPMLGATFEAITSTGALPFERIGPYELVRVIGEGGMGRVFEAVQDQPRRRVALKLLRPGMATASVLRRFRNEAQMLGRLRHRGIAQIHEASTFDPGTGAQPFFAMEYVDGEPLVANAEAHGLDIGARVRLLIAIGDAVQHAHQRGIIHRDLKPENILVEPDGQPKVLDFGVARGLDAESQVTTVQTLAGQVVGTLAYMSPEQVSGSAVDLDIRTDVYALGMIAFELLSGRLPYDVRDRSIPDAIRVICAQEPTALDATDRALRGDLATIVAKAIEKQPARRYASVSEFTADLQRVLDDEPIVARRGSALYHLSKFARRHRAFVTGVAAIALIVVVSVGVIIQALTRAIDAEQTAIDEADRATENAEQSQAITEFMQSIFAAARPDDGGRQDVRVRDLLAPAAQRLETEYADQPRVLAMLHDTLARTYRELEMMDEADEQFRRAIEVCRAYAETSDDFGILAGMITGRGILWRWRGELDQAITCFREACAINLEHHGETHPEYVVALSNLANALVASGALEEAAEPMRTSYELHRTLYDESHFGRAVVTSSYGLLLRQLERYDEAERVQHEALRLFEGADRAEHPAAGRAVMELGTLASIAGRPDDAMRRFDRALAIYDAAYGESSVISRLAHHARIDAQLRAGRAAAALAAIDALPDAPDPPLAAATACRRVRALTALHHFDDAERTLETTFAQIEQGLADGDGRFAHERTMLLEAAGEFFRATGDDATAERWLTR